MRHRIGVVIGLLVVASVALPAPAAATDDIGIDIEVSDATLVGGIEIRVTVANQDPVYRLDDQLRLEAGDHVERRPVSLAPGGEATDRIRIWPDEVSAGETVIEATVGGTTVRERVTIERQTLPPSIVTAEVPAGGTTTVAVPAAVSGERIQAVGEFDEALSVTVSEIDGGSKVVGLPQPGRLQVAVRNADRPTLQVAVQAPDRPGAEFRMAWTATNATHSATTAVRIDVVEPDPLAAYRDGGRVSDAGLQSAIGDWVAGEIDDALLQEVIQAWVAG
jgi:hypothetical protein